MAMRPLLYLCAYVLFLSTAAWATESQQMVWSVGLLSCLAFIGRAGTCKGCGQWVAVAHKPFVPAPLPRIANRAIASRPLVYDAPSLVPTKRVPLKRSVARPHNSNPSEKRPVPVLRFAGRIDHV